MVVGLTVIRPFTSLTFKLNFLLMKFDKVLGGVIKLCSPSPPAIIIKQHHKNNHRNDDAFDYE